MPDVNKGDTYDKNISDIKLTIEEIDDAKSEGSDKYSDELSRKISSLHSIKKITSGGISHGDP